MQTFEEISDLKRKVKSLYRKQNIVGMGVGYKETSGQSTDQSSLMVLVSKKYPLDQLSRRDRVPININGIVTDVVAVGQVTAQNKRRIRVRPAVGGVSIGHPAVSFGTLGTVVRDAESNQQMILSCNHILANQNNAQLGDAILQPAEGDGGERENDTIGKLYRFIPLYYQTDAASMGSPSECGIARFLAALFNAPAILFGAKTRLKAVYNKPVNFVDAALARPERLNDLSHEIQGIGKVTGTARITVGDNVKKSGCSTGITFGEIKSIDTELEVNYGRDIAFFDHQLMTHAMSKGGDSGSLLVNNEDKAAGLLFAGSETHSFFNPIDRIIEALHIVI